LRQAIRPAGPLNQPWLFSAIFLQSLAMRPVHEYNVTMGGDTPQVPVLSKLAMSDQRHNGITSWHSSQVEMTRAPALPDDRFLAKPVADVFCGLPVLRTEKDLRGVRQQVAFLPLREELAELGHRLEYIVSRGIRNQRTVNVILDECATVMAGHGEALDEMLTVGRGFKLKVTAINRAWVPD
jgi:hypothetical protein